MTRGVWLAVAALSAYAALETYTIKSASKRFEPAYIHNLLVEAQAATLACKEQALDSTLALQSRFDRTLLRAAQAYKKKLTQSEPQRPVSDIASSMTKQTQLARERVLQRTAEIGCDHPETKAHFQRFRIYARKSR